jgi:hypothetical protein
MSDTPWLVDEHVASLLTAILLCRQDTLQGEHVWQFNRNTCTYVAAARMYVDRVLLHRSRRLQENRCWQSWQATCFLLPAAVRQGTQRPLQRTRWTLLMACR